MTYTSMKSVKVIIVLMQALGLWHSSCNAEKFRYNISLVLAVVILMVFAIYTQAQELYYAGNSVALLAFVAPVVTITLTELSKLIVFIVQRKRVTTLNKFIDDVLWKKSYTAKEQEIFNDCDNFCFKSICLGASLILVTCSQFVIVPIIGMITSKEREFLFPTRFTNSLYKSPFFEMYFALQLLSVGTAGLCATAFTTYAFAMNLFTAAQFKTLNMNFQSLCDFEEECKAVKNVKYQEEALQKLKDYILRHQMLIDLTKEIEDLYCYVMLEQVFGSVAQTCFCVTQILLVKTTFVRTTLGILFLMSTLMQLYFYCYSSHVIIEASQNVSRAMYFTKWFKITHPKIRKEFMQLMKIVVLRAQKPCILTVGKFYPLSVATFTWVMSMSMSYFTVLRQIIE